MTTKKDYNDLIIEARNLPTHVDGILQPENIFFVQPHGVYHRIYSDSATVADVFNSVGFKKGMFRGYYSKLIPTYRPDGTLNKKSAWETKIFYHKKWARKDIEVVDVDFDIVGIKRETTQLRAAVLISNVKFITE